jgi:hypothetical protein
MFMLTAPPAGHGKGRLPFENGELARKVAQAGKGLPVKWIR